jgi:hypothetical protein
LIRPAVNLFGGNCKFDSAPIAAIIFDLFLISIIASALCV